MPMKTVNETVSAARWGQIMQEHEATIAVLEAEQVKLAETIRRWRRDLVNARDAQAVAAHSERIQAAKAAGAKDVAGVTVRVGMKVQGPYGFQKVLLLERCRDRYGRIATLAGPKNGANSMMIYPYERYLVKL